MREEEEVNSLQYWWLVDMNSQTRRWRTSSVQSLPSCIYHILVKGMKPLNP